MHTHRLFLCLTLSMFLAAGIGAQAQTSSPERAVTLPNPDFENGKVEGWGLWAVTDDVSSAANHTSGGQYAASPSLNVKDGPFGEGALVLELSDLRPGDEYRLTAWARADALEAAGHGAVKACLKTEYWNASGQIISAVESQKVTGTSEWRELRVADRIPTGTVKVKILLHLKNDGGVGNSGAVFFDDVRLVLTK